MAICHCLKVEGKILNKKNGAANWILLAYPASPRHKPTRKIYCILFTIFYLMINNALRIELTVAHFGP